MTWPPGIVKRFEREFGRTWRQFQRAELQGGPGAIAVSRLAMRIAMREGDFGGLGGGQAGFERLIADADAQFRARIAVRAGVGEFQFVFAGGDDFDLEPHFRLGVRPAGEPVVGKAGAVGELQRRVVKRLRGVQLDGVVLRMADRQRETPQALAGDVGEPGVVTRGEVFHDVGMRRGDVVLLAGVVFHVVELPGPGAGVIGLGLGAARRALDLPDQPVLLRAHGSGELVRLVDRVVREERAFGPGRGVFPLQKGPQRDAIHFRSGGRSHAAEIEQRGEQIDVRGDGLHHVRPPFGRRPADEERHAAAPLMHAGFAAAHPGVVGLHARRAAVVGEEQDDGVLREPLGVQVGEQTAHVVIDVLAHAVEGGQGVVEAPGLELVEILVRHLEGRVRCVIGEIAEERRLPVRGDEFQRLVGEHVGDVAAGRLVSRSAQQRGVEVLVPMAVVEAEEFVKALPLRREGELLAIVPLADAGGAIAGGFREPPPTSPPTGRMASRLCVTPWQPVRNGQRPVSSAARVGAQKEFTKNRSNCTPDAASLSRCGVCRCGFPWREKSP